MKGVPGARRWRRDQVEGAVCGPTPLGHGMVGVFMTRRRLSVQCGCVVQQEGSCLTWVCGPCPTSSSPTTLPAGLAPCQCTACVYLGSLDTVQGTGGLHLALDSALLGPRCLSLRCVAVHRRQPGRWFCASIILARRSRGVAGNLPGYLGRTLTSFPLCWWCVGWRPN